MIKHKKEGITDYTSGLYSFRLQSKVVIKKWGFLEIQK